MIIAFNDSLSLSFAPKRFIEKIVSRWWAIIINLAHNTELYTSEQTRKFLPILGKKKKCKVEPRYSVPRNSDFLPADGGSH